ncbi:MAG: hypothetical protein M3O26_20795 [Pseudomonadota bacterium]|nr:hypothetical protein [Pseudomonadota bacterium]
MLNILVGAFFLGFAATSFGSPPTLDNERVAVWDARGAMPRAVNDFIAVPLSRKGTAYFGHKGDAPGKAGARTVVIELKDHSTAPIPNNSGYPLAFPRPSAKKLFENDKVIVWDYTWRPHEPTPMHFHNKDAVVVFEATGALQSTTPDGKSVVSENQFGDIRFNRGNRTHTELLLRGNARAVIVELK